MKNKPKIIVITGAESTGKSTLTERLANHFEVPYIAEIAREYVEKLDHKYSYTDVENIAKMQIAKFNSISKSDAPYIFVDTWLIITKIWFEFVYNKTPDWLIHEILKTKIDLFLVCDIDLPWIYDPVRENGGENRKILQNKYIENITEFNFDYRLISGIDDERFYRALNFLKELD
ncbi:MAG: nad metabolism ATPase/kinase-like [Prolixibacteraceae bacterium]|nr:MAG: nad metabolism ATPase/kinase-like [Prolixibacteraceae bacterium]